MKSHKVLRRIRIRKKIRSAVNGTSSKPRLSIFRSNKEIYAQLIDDINGKTLLGTSSSSKELAEIKGTKTEKAKNTGKLLAEKAISAGITQVVFDRGGYLYHGRVKALADGAREAGLGI